jgi:hypothetical protein
VGHGIEPAQNSTPTCPWAAMLERLIPFHVLGDRSNIGGFGWAEDPSCRRLSDLSPRLNQSQEIVDVLRDRSDWRSLAGRRGHLLRFVAAILTRPLDSSRLLDSCPYSDLSLRLDTRWVMESKPRQNSTPTCPLVRQVKAGLLLAS